jgi:hypothetical protein
MILASHHGKDEKIKEYIRSLEHFLISAEDKYKHTQSKDIKNDIMIMMNDIVILLDHVHEDFPSTR